MLHHYALNCFLSINPRRETFQAGFREGLQSEGPGGEDEPTPILVEGFGQGYRANLALQKEIATLKYLIGKAEDRTETPKPTPEEKERIRVMNAKISDVSETIRRVKAKEIGQEALLDRLDADLEEICKMSRDMESILGIKTQS